MPTHLCLLLVFCCLLPHACRLLFCLFLILYPSSCQLMLLYAMCYLPPTACSLCLLVSSADYFWQTDATVSCHLPVVCYSTFYLMLYVAGVDLVGLIGWLATPLLEKQTWKKIAKDCEYYGRNKGKRSGQVPHCNFYFVALLVFLVWQFSIRFQFSNCNILGACPIDSATPRYQPPLPPPPPVKNPGSAPVLHADCCLLIIDVACCMLLATFSSAFMPVTWCCLLADTWGLLLTL